MEGGRRKERWRERVRESEGAEEELVMYWAACSKHDFHSRLKGAVCTISFIFRTSKEILQKDFILTFSFIYFGGGG